MTQPISSAPMNGVEILVWREDTGWLLARWIAPCDFLTEDELAHIQDADTPDWFYADFVAGGRMDDPPTHWMPMPNAPDFNPSTSPKND